MISNPQTLSVDPLSTVQQNQIVEPSAENEGTKSKESRREQRRKAEEDLSDFKPEGVITRAHESLTSAMASYGQKNTKDALVIFENHVKEFEGKGTGLQFRMFWTSLFYTRYSILRNSVNCKLSSTVQ